MDPKVYLYIFIMALVTYLVRMLPLVLFRKKIESRFIKSFLYYVPYAVLGAMTLPDILSSTGSIYSALLGLGAAVILAFREKGLLTVALCSCGVVFVAECVLRLLGVM